MQHGDAHDLDLVSRDHVGVVGVRIGLLVLILLFLLVITITRSRVMGQRRGQVFQELLHL